MSVKNKIFLPTLISSVTYQPVRTLPHIYFYNGLKDCEEYYIQHYPSGSTSTVTSSVQEQFPYMDYYDGLTPGTGSNSLLFFNETPPYGVAPTASLYTEYWDKYVSLLYNPRTRLIKASAIIPLSDYFEMELNDIVQFRGNYYHLRAINDYNLKDGTCKIELLGPIIKDAAPTTEIDCSFYFSSSIEGLVPTTTSTTTASPTTSTTTTIGPTTTTTLAPVSASINFYYTIDASELTGSEFIVGQKSLSAATSIRYTYLNGVTTNIIVRENIDTLAGNIRVISGSLNATDYIKYVDIVWYASASSAYNYNSWTASLFTNTGYGATYSSSTEELSFNATNAWQGATNPMDNKDAFTYQQPGVAYTAITGSIKIT